jgi:hypothetical protein
MYKQLEHLQKKPKAKSFQHIHIKITSNIPAEKLELVEKVEKELEGEEEFIDEDFVYSQLANKFTQLELEKLINDGDVKKHFLSTFYEDVDPNYLFETGYYASQR